MSALAPILAVSVADPKRFLGLTSRAFRYFMVLAGALCVAMTIGARLIVHFLYGSQFLPAAPLLAVLIWSEIPVFFAAVVVNALIAKNQQRLLPIPTLVGAAVNVALNLVLIPRYGAIGSAYATVISYTLAWMVVLLFSYHARPVMRHGLKFAVPISVFALVVVIVTRSLPVPAFAQLLTGIAAFLSVASVTGIIRREDIAFMKTAFAKAVSVAR
jgi:PST family polysaccharide transporter